MDPAAAPFSMAGHPSHLAIAVLVVLFVVLVVALVAHRPRPPKVCHGRLAPRGRRGRGRVAGAGRTLSEAVGRLVAHCHPGHAPVLVLGRISVLCDGRPVHAHRLSAAGPVSSAPGRLRRLESKLAARARHGVPSYVVDAAWVCPHSEHFESSHDSERENFDGDAFENGGDAPEDFVGGDAEDFVGGDAEDFVGGDAEDFEAAGEFVGSGGIRALALRSNAESEAAGLAMTDEGGPAGPPSEYPDSLLDSPAVRDGYRGRPGCRLPGVPEDPVARSTRSQAAAEALALRSTGAWFPGAGPSEGFSPDGPSGCRSEPDLAADAERDALLVVSGAI